MKRLVQIFGEPTVLTTEKTPSLLCALKKLKKQGFYAHAIHYTAKYLNNLTEQDHHVKRRFVKYAGFQSLRLTSRTIKRIETIHALYKQKRSLHKQTSFFLRTVNCRIY